MEQATVDICIRELVIIESRTRRLQVDCLHTLDAIRSLRSALGYGTDSDQGEVGDGKSPRSQTEDPSQPYLFSFAGWENHDGEGRVGGSEGSEE